MQRHNSYSSQWSGMWQTPGLVKREKILQGSRVHYIGVLKAESQCPKYDVDLLKVRQFVKLICLEKSQVKLKS